MKTLKVFLLGLIILACVSAIMTWAQAPASPMGATPAPSGAYMGMAAPTPALDTVPPTVQIPEYTIVGYAPRTVKRMPPRAVKIAAACDPFGPTSVCVERDLMGGSGGKVLACDCGG
jgi:hypothetical protein